MKTIQLGNEVMVSDPCYEVPTWCQHKLTNVLPGEYFTNIIESDEGDWGIRIGALVTIHKDYVNDPLSFRAVSGADIGVDSGQAGIFSMETYRNDELFKEDSSNFYGSYDKVQTSGYNKESGDHWYGHMCDRTLGDERWGVYDRGVVSSSGYGDGSYELSVAKHKGKIVGIAIDYLGFKKYALPMAITKELS
jgi:hypothetical protein